jgi:asparagine synthase (glutamine-hydrolysing)
MTILAGAFASGGTGRVPTHLKDHVTKALNRSQAGRITTHECSRAWVVKMDLGAFPENADYQDDDGSFTVACGQPLVDLANGTVELRRDNDVRYLHRELTADRIEALRTTRGVFSLVCVPSGGSRLLIAADHLAIRPVYVRVMDGLVLFSSTLRVLSARAPDNLPLDIRGCMESALFEYPLGRRTPYADIFRLAPAEVLEVLAGGEVRSRRYWHWQEAAPPPDQPSTVSDGEIYQEFRRAIQLRLKSDRATVAYLSGGMDSRAIVSVLRDLDIAVHTFNFSIPGQQDQYFAERFAEEAATQHTFVPRTERVDLQGGDWSFMLSRAWHQSMRPESAPVERPNAVWSGDGGSVLVGDVIVGGSAALIAEKLLEGDMSGAARIHTPRVPRRALAPRLRPTSNATVLKGVLEELEGTRHADPLRTFYLYRLFNDQRRHLDGHFEQIDLHGMEFHLPFFDAAFVKKILQVPMKRLRNHRFYHEWFDHFPPCARAVPWQTYPGHLPCPVPDPRNLSDQWSGDHGLSSKTVARNSQRRRRNRLLRMVFSSSFPSDVLSRPHIIGAGLLHLLRIRDQRHIIDFAYRVFQHAEFRSPTPRGRPPGGRAIS